DVGPGTVIRFGHVTEGPRVVLTAPPRNRPSAVAHPALPHTFRQPTSVRPLPTRTVRIRRAPHNDVAVADTMVSRHHAELHVHADGGYEIVDLGSHNGTYLNGVPVQRHEVAQGDIVGVGHSDFCLIGDELQQYVDTGEVSLDVQDLTVTVDRGR